MDGSEPVADLVEGLPDVRYLRLSTRTSIGRKRNLACRRARGEIIAHWDDDDWYAPGRLSYQVAPIRAGEADVTGLENSYILELPGGQFWATHPRLQALIQQALRRGKRLARLVNAGVFVYIRHGHNAWRFETGRFLDPAGWERVESPPTFSAEMLAAYQAALRGA